MCFVLLGLCAGTLAGLLGIGGATVMIPGLVYLFGFGQHQAQGTTLMAMVPPIGLLAALTYYKKGYVDLGTALFLCLGFFFGALIGAKAAVSLPAGFLRRAFGVFLLLVSLHMILKP